MALIYLVSSPEYRLSFQGKIGCTWEPYGRLRTYLTGCPPGRTPSSDLNYDALWETSAMTDAELKDLEDIVHDYFLEYRMMRKKPGDSEWFDFKGLNPYEEVKKFMDVQPWVKRQMPVSEIIPPQRLCRYLQKQHHKNLKYIKCRNARNEALDKIQEPVISAVIEFIANPEIRAGYIIAPCGSGKTVMTVRGIRSIRRAIVCCPSTQIQKQWCATLITENQFLNTHIHYVGGAGTTDPEKIRAILQMDTFYIISTYMSSHLLADIIGVNMIDVELLILDEAHHMAGIVAGDEGGEGRTRLLMSKASEMNIKRLSLTYTPRFVTNDENSDKKYLTMDNDRIFGKKVAELKIRDLIQKGVLPDYRIWTTRDEALQGTGILGKAECMLEAWGATEIDRGEEKYILHHLIVFAATIQEAKDLEKFFNEHVVDTTVLRVQEGDTLEGPIEQFTAAPRAILINCFVLNEGVDIPIANAVAITYPKQSRGQIIQMFLRPGRWHENKSIFHILIPVIGDEDLSGFEEVLSALASCDEQIMDEIVMYASAMGDTVSAHSSSTSGSINKGISPEHIMIDEYDGSKREEIKQCFVNIRKNLFPIRESGRIRELCITEYVDTSVEYSTSLRQRFPELPEDPRPKNYTWYNYLHQARGGRMSGQDFVKNILEPNSLYAGRDYDNWREVQPTDVIAKLPSVQHISDGFFGGEAATFNELREKFGGGGKRVSGRGGH